MFRLIGFIIGCVASIGALFALIGVPEFHFGDNDDAIERYDAAIDKLKSKRRGAFADEALESEAAKLGSPGVVTPPSNVAVDERVTERVADDEPPALADIPETNDVVPTPAPTSLGEPTWHAFWNPFRSEIAALGFVSRLESVTGLDYRVEKVKAGVYEVAFSYQTDDELSNKLAQISSATGLDLSDTLP